MKPLPQKLVRRLDERKAMDAFRELRATEELVDFSSNDYLGFSGEHLIEEKANAILKGVGIDQNGATGSRLISGNHGLYVKLEEFLFQYHKAEASLVFNSGYDANLGFFASVPQRNDVVFYDELCHASIRDGIRLSNAKSVKFKHNDLKDLHRHIERLALGHTKVSQNINGIIEVYVVTESVFSMDGDSPDLNALASFCSDNGLHLVVDEAHAVGVFGKGLVNELDVENEVFARIITFGKALGVHGAAILGSFQLRDYLINFCRSLIYTTALPPHTLASIMASYQMLTSKKGETTIKKLNHRVAQFKSLVEEMELNAYFKPNESPIQACIVGRNRKTKKLSRDLRRNGFDVRPILSPTVPKGQERLRICLHSFNTEDEIATMLQTIKIQLHEQ